MKPLGVKLNAYESNINLTLNTNTYLTAQYQKFSAFAYANLKIDVGQIASNTPKDTKINMCNIYSSEECKEANM